MPSGTLTCAKDIDDFITSVDTGDILFFTTGLFHSVISFSIRTVCNSEWTHSAMIVRHPITKRHLVWESVNQHRDTSIFTDIRTGMSATGSGVRLIDFSTFIHNGYGCLKTMGRKTCIFAVLRLDRSLPQNELLKREIEDYVVRNSIKTKMIYPKTIYPLKLGTMGFLAVLSAVESLRPTM